jgi:hypothetical protein
MANPTSNNYPFTSKKDIKARIVTDYSYACACIVTLFNLQTAHEQDTSSTLSRNHAGFMSSHAVHGTRIAKALIAGEALTDEDVARVTTIAGRYTKQLAAQARQDAIEADPELAVKAAAFFTVQG